MSLQISLLSSMIKQTLYIKLPLLSLSLLSFGQIHTDLMYLFNEKRDKRKMSKLKI